MSAGHDHRPRVLVVHNSVPDDAPAAERDVLEQVAIVAQACSELNYACDTMSCDLDLRPLLARVEAFQPTVVFSLVESLAGRDQLAWLVPALLETIHVPCTGNAAIPLNLSNDKLRTKERLQLAGLPTPAWYTLEGLSSGATSAQFIPGQYILKAISEHASLGLDDAAIAEVTSSAELRDRLQQQTARLGKACFAEQFIAGREFNISLLANGSQPQVLPAAEIDFSKFPTDKPRIVGQAAKWDAGSFEFDHTPRQFDFPASDAGLLALLGSIARSCWQVLELAGWVRVDFRVDEQGQPWILEVNTNPCLSADAGFAAAVQQAGLSLTQAVERIVAAALPDLPAGTPPAARPRSSQSSSITLRSTVHAADEAHVREIVAATGMFRPNEVDVAAELVRVRLRDGASSGYEFLFAEDDGQVLGYACYGLNTVTLGSYDLYWIAVRPALQGRGIGQQLLQAAEANIAAAGGQRIYIETSARPDYAATRYFYERCGYALEAILRDYYATADDKAVFVRRIHKSKLPPAGQ
ncbi:GNAT family N-acetyltransferase [Anatilimnocola sp. NA78]|uniref:GNAT family N-acetyltransferase n=1 Tax=Anatilimnocola sp. NA78 TaxID=3415683 RepID=UPI003CE569F5